MVLEGWGELVVIIGVVVDVGGFIVKLVVDGGGGGEG